MAVTRVRWKQPRGTKAAEAAYPFAKANLAATFEAAPQDLRFAFAVAAFADVLRGGDDAKGWSLAKIREAAHGAAGSDLDRAELLSLMDKAIALSQPAATTAAIAK
jgi:Ca-activated chloride channel family protein